MARLLYVARTNRVDTQLLAEFLQLLQGRKERGRCWRTCFHGAADRPRARKRSRACSPYRARSLVEGWIGLKSPGRVRSPSRPSSDLRTDRSVATLPRPARRFARRAAPVHRTVPVRGERSSERGVQPCDNELDWRRYGSECEVETHARRCGDDAGAELPAAGPADAGAVVLGAHPARLFRDRLPDVAVVRGVAVSAQRRSALSDARASLDERDGRSVCRGCGDRDDPQLRDGVALAGLHRELRQCLRARLRRGGLLVFPRGDLHRHLRVRLEPPVAAVALRHRHPDRRSPASPAR